MNKLILILLITISFGAKGIEGIGNGEVLNYLFNSDWYKGKNNPNGQTFAITYTPSDFMGFDADSNSNVKSSELVIPLTDFFTITQSRFYVNLGDDNFNSADGVHSIGWKGGSPNTQISFHLPINWD
jgi:hypothetical protein